MIERAAGEETRSAGDDFISGLWAVWFLFTLKRYNKSGSEHAGGRNERHTIHRAEPTPQNLSAVSVQHVWHDGVHHVSRWRLVNVSADILMWHEGQFQSLIKGCKCFNVSFFFSRKQDDGGRRDQRQHRWSDCVSADVSVSQEKIC